MSKYQKEQGSRYPQRKEINPELLEGKIPPQATDFEEAVLGACMLEPEAFDKTSKYLTTSMFYKDNHQKIYKAIVSLSTKNSPIDILTVTDELKNRDELEEIGGPAFLVKLTNKIASAAHTEYHSQIIYQMYVQREIIRTCYSLQSIAFSDDFDTVMENYSDFTNVVDNLITMRRTDRSLAEIMVDHEREMLRRAEQAKQGKESGIPTGFAELDTKTSGWQPGDLVILAARPSMGKTAVALHIGKQAAINNISTCFFSIEMDDIRLADRLICSEGGIDASNLKRGTLTEPEKMAYSNAANNLAMLPFWIDDNPKATVNSIRAIARTKHRKGDCGLIIIDYLQLIESTSERKDFNREREVAEISRSLKLLAKELGIPVILLCQLNRAAENRSDKRPQLSDLRESGAIEQDADVVLLPYRPEYYGYKEDVEGNSLEGVGILITAKNRNGSVGDIYFRYSPDLSQIYDFKLPF